MNVRHTNFETRNGGFVQRIDNPGASGLPGTVAISLVSGFAHIEQRLEQMYYQLRQAQTQRDAALAEAEASRTRCAKVEMAKALSEQRTEVDMMRKVHILTEENRRLRIEIFHLRADGLTLYEWDGDSLPWSRSPN